MGKARALTREFQSNVDDMIREAELQELHKQVADLGSINPLASLERAIDINPHPVPETKEPSAADADMTVPFPTSDGTPTLTGESVQTHPVPTEAMASNSDA